MSVIIFVSVANEPDTLRPVHADHIEADVYEITVAKEPGREKWLFPPLSRVRCREQVFDDGTRGFVAFELA